MLDSFKKFDEGPAHVLSNTWLTQRIACPNISEGAVDISASRIINTSKGQKRSGKVIKLRRQIVHWQGHEDPCTKDVR